MLVLFKNHHHPFVFFQGLCTFYLLLQCRGQCLGRIISIHLAVSVGLGPPIQASQQIALQHRIRQFLGLRKGEELARFLIIYQRIELDGLLLAVNRAVVSLRHTDEDELVRLYPSFYQISTVDVCPTDDFFSRGIMQASEVQLIHGLKRMVIRQPIHRIIVRKADEVLPVQRIGRTAFAMR